MYEIELKAHVHFPDNVSALLDNFATRLKDIEKDDVYYHCDEKNVTCRIRTESFLPSNNFDKCETHSVFTYKRKNHFKNPDGILTEVNEEFECVIEKSSALEQFLLDLDFVVNLKKHKSVRQWIKETAFGKAHIELCNVEPLGYFLEIEFMTSDNSSNIVKNIHNEIKNIFSYCRIDESDIEERRYSEMLSCKLTE